MRDPRLRAQVLDGTWEDIGIARETGVIPESIAPVYNEQGPDTLGFTLRRDPEKGWPDLRAFTPLEYLPAGDQVTWGGFILDAPGSSREDPQLTVQAQGWQHHLDDDTFNKLFVARDLSAWQDARTRPEVNLGLTPANLRVEAGSGAIHMGWPKGIPYTAQTHAIALIDLGPDATARAIGYDYESTALTGNAAFEWFIRGSNDLLFNSAANDVGFFNFGGAPAAQSGLFFNFPSPARYISLWLKVLVTGNPTGDDHMIRITGLRLFGEPTYHALGQSALKASAVVKHARGFAPLLDPTDELISEPTFSIPAFGDPKASTTPREAMTRANDYMGWLLKVDQRRRVVYRARSDRAGLETSTARDGVAFQDTSVNSGRETYNKVVVRGTSGSGEPLSIVRYAANLPGAAQDTVNVGQPPNPSADVDATGWTRTSAQGALTRTTAAGEFFSGPGGFKMANTTSTDEVVFETPSVVTTLKKGGQYRLDANVKIDPFVKVLTVTIILAPSGRTFTIDVSRGAAIVEWRQETIQWAQETDDTSYKIRLNGLTKPGGGGSGPTGPIGFFDDFKVGRTVLTEPDKRGFLRTKELQVAVPTDLVAMAALGDAYLQRLATIGMSGSLTVAAEDGVKTTVGGRPVPPDELGLYTGELLQISNLIDPMTGALGRAGIINQVSVADGVATVALSSSRGNFEALMARMAVTAAP